MAKGGDDSKLFAFLAVFLTVIGFIIALAAKKNDKYVMYYGKQGLVIFIAWIVLWIASFILSFIPILGLVAVWLFYLAILVLWVFGLINSLSGEMKPVPVVGQFADNIHV